MGGLSAYPFFVTLGIFTNFVMLFALAHRKGLPQKLTIDLSLVIFISALVGAKLFHCFFEASGHVLSTGASANNFLDLFSDDPFHAVRFLSPGYVLYGGLIFGLVAGLLYLRRQKQLILLFVDCWAVAFLLGLFVGRLGCLFSGCCYGKPTDLFIGRYHPMDIHHELAILHPVPLYESLFALALFLMCLLAMRLKYKTRDGAIGLIVLLLYAFFRFLVEFLRGDEDRGIWLFGFSTSQWVSLIILLVLLLITSTKPFDKIQKKRLNSAMSPPF